MNRQACMERRSCGNQDTDWSNVVTNRVKVEAPEAGRSKEGVSSPSSGLSLLAPWLHTSHSYNWEKVSYGSSKTPRGDSKENAAREADRMRALQERAQLAKEETIRKDSCWTRHEKSPGTLCVFGTKWDLNVNPALLVLLANGGPLDTLQQGNKSTMCCARNISLKGAWTSSKYQTVLPFVKKDPWKQNLNAHVLVPRTCECSLIWQGILQIQLNKDLEVSWLSQIIRVGPKYNHKLLFKRETEENVTSERRRWWDGRGSVLGNVLYRQKNGSWAQGSGFSTGVYKTRGE